MKYVVFDKENKAGTAERKISYTDYTPPQIYFTDSLLQDTLSTTKINRITGAVSCVDGDISNNVNIKINVMEDNVLPLTVSVEDSTGTESILNVNYDYDRTLYTAKIVLKDYMINVPVGGIYDFKEKMFQAIRKSWKIFLLFFLVVQVAAAAYVKFTYRPEYGAEVTFAVSKELNGEKNYEYNRKATDELETSFTSIVNSDIMQNEMLDHLKNDKKIVTLTSDRIGTTNLFTVTAKASEKDDAVQMIKAFMESYPTVFKKTLMEIELEVVKRPEEKAALLNRPEYVRIMVYGAAGSALVYFAVLMLYVLIYKTVTEEEDIKIYFHNVCLGTLPYVRQAEKNDTFLIAMDDSRYLELKDSIRSVRRILEKLKAGKGYSFFYV